MTLTIFPQITSFIVLLHHQLSQHRSSQDVAKLLMQHYILLYINLVS